MAAFTGAGAVVFNTTSGNKSVALAGATAGDLLVVVCGITGVATLPGLTDTQSGTYTEITGGVAQGASTRLWVFVRDALVPTTASTTLNMTITGDTGGGFAVFRLTGMSRVGAAAVRQYATDPNKAASTTPTPVLASAALTGNALIGGVLNSTNPATMTPPQSPTAWTEKYDVGYTGPLTGFEIVTRDNGYTGTSTPWGSASASANCSAIVEMDTSAAGTQYNQPAADTLSLADAQAYDRGAAVADTATPSDAQTFDRAAVLTDALALADTAGLGREVRPADTASATDAAPTLETGKGVTLGPDAATLADAVALARGEAVADAATLTDAVALTRGLALADALGLADDAQPVLTPAGGTAWAQPIDDTLNAVDALSRGLAPLLADSLALADAWGLGRGLGVVDALPLATAIRYDRGLVVTDPLGLADVATLAGSNAAVPIFTPATRTRGSHGATGSTGAGGDTRVRGLAGRTGTIGLTGRTATHE